MDRSKGIGKGDEEARVGKRTGSNGRRHDFQSGFPPVMLVLGLALRPTDGGLGLDLKLGCLSHLLAFKINVM